MKTVAPLMVGLLCAGLVHAADQEAFDVARSAFVDRMVAEHGFERDGVAAILADAELNERVLEAISRPAERVVPWHEYRGIFVTDARVAAGVEFWNRHTDTLGSAAERFGVPPELLVAIVGVESYFGQRMGNYRVLDSLATLAFAYPPRAAFFAGELEAFLLLAREEDLPPLEPRGSYAGAMGAGQFIPSSYRAYAVDGNGDGRRELWGDWNDVLGSVANYFKMHGWRLDEPVVDRAERSAEWSGSEPSNSLDLDETVGSLVAMGYRFAPALPESSRALALALEGPAGTTEYWVGYHNFYVITRYNRSVKYALAVHELSRAIVDARAMADRSAAR